MVNKTKEMTRETREKLLESALDVMSTKSFSAVSLDEIASRVGLSRGAVYWHFKNKEDLLASLIKHVCENIGPDAIGDGKSLENLGDMRLFFKNKLKEAASNERAQKMNKLFHRRNEWPENFDATALDFITEMNDRQCELVTDLISRCQDKGEVRTDFSAFELATYLCTVFQEMFFTMLNKPLKVNFENYADFIFDALENELKNRGDTG